MSFRKWPFHPMAVVAWIAMLLAGCSTPPVYSVQEPASRAGVVESIRSQAVQTANSTAGTVLGAVAGGLLGNMVGGGTGRTVATVVGAVGGGYAGNRIAEHSQQMVWFIDVTTETKPFGVASWTVPESSGRFCARGGRFGTHSSSESTAPVFHKRILFFAHFNAGVRALDVRDPFHPKEIAYFIPAMTANTVVLDTPAGQGTAPPGEAATRRAIQTNNVEVDERGYVYIVDRANTGLHILELTGSARAVADWAAAARD